MLKTLIFNSIIDKSYGPLHFFAIPVQKHILRARKPRTLRMKIRYEDKDYDMGKYIDSENLHNHVKLAIFKGYIKSSSSIHLTTYTCQQYSKAWFFGIYENLLYSFCL